MSNIALVFLSALLIFWAFPPSASVRREFHIGPNKTDRKTAEEYCKINYIGLVTVYDEQDNIKLSNLINNNKVNNVSNGWIGTRRGESISMKWSNGDDVTFNRSLPASCGEICCAAMNADGGWESIKCSEKRPFMCYEQVPDVERKSYNYSLIRENKTWFEAQLYCRENHTDLVSIRNETEKERVMEEGEQSNTSFWIGLLEDRVEWEDGGKSAYRNWFSNPNTSSPYPEAIMDSRGIWYGSTGSDSYPLCYTFSTSASEHRLRGFHIGPTQMKRDVAETYCKRKYTGLVTVYDKQDNTELSKLIPSNGWIGTRRGESISMKWSNGDDVTFNKSLGSCGELCCAAMNADGGWESMKCSEKRPFMCYEQVPDVGRNYSLIRETKSWFEAQLYCREHHTDLVSIRNETENERVMEEGKQSNTSFWMGLLEDSVEWEDGGKSAYRNWIFPNTVTSSHYLSVIMTLNGNWSKGGISYPLCYKSFIHVSESSMSWEDALDYCDTQPKTGLLTIHSHKDQIEMEQELNRRNISGPVWVGLRQSRLFGFWIWINGLNVGSYSNWKEGRQPGQISHYCGAIENGQYKWCDKDCRKKYRVLCEIKY